MFGTQLQIISEKSRRAATVWLLSSSTYEDWNWRPGKGKVGRETLQVCHGCECREVYVWQWY